MENNNRKRVIVNSRPLHSYKTSHKEFIYTVKKFSEQFPNETLQNEELTFTQQYNKLPNSLLNPKYRHNLNEDWSLVLRAKLNFLESRLDFGGLFEIKQKSGQINEIEISILDTNGDTFKTCGVLDFTLCGFPDILSNQESILKNDQLSLRFKLVLTEKSSGSENDMNDDSLNTHLQSLLRKTVFKPDVILQCDDKSIGVHKTILACRSSVFSQMFELLDEPILDYNNLKSIQLADVTFEELTLLLMHMYGGEIVFSELSTENMVRLIELTDRYQLLGLKSLTMSNLLEMMTKNNIETIKKCVESFGTKENIEYFKARLDTMLIPNLDVNNECEFEDNTLAIVEEAEDDDDYDFEGDFNDDAVDKPEVDDSKEEEDTTGPAQEAEAEETIGLVGVEYEPEE